MEEIRPTHTHRPRISVDHKYSLSISLSLSCADLSLLSFDVSVMQGLDDRPDFESDFGFLLFWFDDFQRVVEWATGFCCLGLMAGELVFFLFDFL
jgi:hypothetical protein